MTNAFISVLVLTFLLQTSKCARKAMEGFVIGGRIVDISENPHSVFLDAHCKTPWICGSALLNQRIIMTAAHCIFGCEVGRGHHITALAGSGNLKAIRFKRFVKRIIVHKKYNETRLLNDIGLALLNSNFPLGDTVKRVIIRRAFPHNTYFAKVAGWGTVNEDTGRTSTLLKQVPQKLRSKVTCAKIGRLIAGMFCAGSENYYEDCPAEGDSGGALVTNSCHAIGLLSFRSPVYPALLVYTNITYYYDWVTTSASELYCKG